MTYLKRFADLCLNIDLDKVKFNNVVSIVKLDIGEISILGFRAFSDLSENATLFPLLFLKALLFSYCL